MKFTFEDDLAKFPNILLDKSCCTGYYGCLNLLNNIAVLNNTVCFIDTPADNISAISNFKMARSLSKKCNNVYVIPIPCTEYIFIREFMGYSTPESKIALTFGDFRSIKRSVYHRSIDANSYEHFCKMVLRTNKPCFRNNVFVTSNCLCDHSQADCSELSIYDKKHKYTSNFPIPISSKVSIDIGKAVSDCYDLYYKMANSFYNLGIIKRVIPIV